MSPASQSITVTIAATPARVWAVMSDVAHWPEWTRSVTSIKRLDKGPFGVGSRALIKQPGFPPAMWKVTAIEPGRSFTWVSGMPGMWVKARHLVEAVREGTRATLSLEFSGLFGGLMARMTRATNERYLGMEAAGLKQRSEGG